MFTDKASMGIPAHCHVHNLHALHKFCSQPIFPVEQGRFQSFITSIEGQPLTPPHSVSTSEIVTGETFGSRMGIAVYLDLSSLLRKKSCGLAFSVGGVAHTHSLPPRCFTQEDCIHCLEQSQLRVTLVKGREPHREQGTRGSSLPFACRARGKETPTLLLMRTRGPAVLICLKRCGYLCR